MRIAWLVPARYAEVSGDGTMSILGGGVDTLVLTAPVDPPILTVTLALRVVGSAREWLAEHDLSVTVRDEAGTTRSVYKQRLRIVEAPDIEPGREIGMLVPATCRWRPGDRYQFTFTVSIDGDEHAVADIAIAQHPGLDSR